MSIGLFSIENGECALSDAHADLWFQYPDDSPEDPFGGTLNQLRKLKQRHPEVRTMMVVGGWAYSASFSDVAHTSEARTTFASSCVAMMRQYEFNGISISWQFPVEGGAADNVRRASDKQTYTLLLQAIRDAMNVNEDLSVAISADETALNNVELNSIGSIVSWIDVLSIDYSHRTDTITNHVAPLHANPAAPTSYSVASSLSACVSAGVPAEKLSVSLPLYGIGCCRDLQIDLSHLFFANYGKALYFGRSYYFITFAVIYE